MRLILLLCLFITAFSAIAVASTIRDEEHVCPLDGTKFSSMIVGSDTTFGSMLDLQPKGRAPYPWPVPKCPTDGFIMYKKFTEEELKLLKPYIKSKEYQKMQQIETNYYLLYKINEKLGTEDSILWYNLLQATWETREHYNRYAAETLSILDRLLTNPKTDEKDKTVYFLISGELYRRIGNFSKAKEVFDALKKRPKPLDDDIDDGVYEAVIEYELLLIDEKNSTSQDMPNK